MLRLSRRRAMLAVTITASSVAAATAALAQGTDDYMRTAGGLGVYLGVMPAELVKGQPVMHGGVPAGRHEDHIVVAIFDAASGGAGFRCNGHRKSVGAWPFRVRENVRTDEHR